MSLYPPILARYLGTRDVLHKAKQDVIDNFVKEQKRRRQHKLVNRMKTVRQLMSAATSQEEAIACFESCQEYLEAYDEDNASQNEPETSNGSA